MEELDITISADGKISIHVKGVKGPACTDLTKALEAALGDVTEKSLTAEYYEQPPDIQAGQELRD